VLSAEAKHVNTKTLIIPDITKTESNNLIICFAIDSFEINTNKPIVTLNTVYSPNREKIALGNHALFVETAYTLVSYLLVSSKINCRLLANTDSKYNI